MAQDSPKGEIIYHVFQRSFYDTNGDLHGDLNGVRQKLDYLQEFAVDFGKIDPEFGTMQDYVSLVKDCTGGE